MKTGDKITLSNGEQATVVSGDINPYKYALVVELENHDVRVVDRETLTLAKANPHEIWGITRKSISFK
ncbi:bacteriocin [Lactococcus lactis]|nr:bacteriocin [Lactococcus lactis]MCO0817560.1 bacteriocin [Lactococcus lactis]